VLRLLLWVAYYGLLLLLDDESGCARITRTLCADGRNNIKRRGGDSVVATSRYVKQSAHSGVYHTEHIFCISWCSNSQLQQVRSVWQQLDYYGVYSSHLV
jgi:hypothetical protein